MAVHEVTFPITDPQEILKLRAGDEVIVQGHIIGIRDRTQIRIFDEGVEPPMDLKGAFLLHTAPNVRKVSTDSEGKGTYEKICIGTTTSARMVRFTEPLEDYRHEHQTPRTENGIEYGDLVKFLDFDFIAKTAEVVAKTLG